MVLVCKVSMEDMMTASSNEKKRVEPLFVAMSGFIGVALMFVVSVLFLPKLVGKSRNGPQLKSDEPDDFSALTRLVMQAIHGKDCSARIACEVGQAMRKMRLDNKPLR